ncbi:MAG: hypothetical protein NVS3B5_20530 [Sphingomicrobium sp.]
MCSISKQFAYSVASMVIALPALAASSDYYLRFKGPAGEATAQAGHKEEIEISSWSWGASNARKGWDGTVKGGSSIEKYGAVGGMHRNDGFTPAQRNVAVGLVAPLDRGSVRIKVKFPWLECKPGAAFPAALLQNAVGRYELKDVVVTSCPAALPNAGRDLVVLEYAKVIVRGWDPANKEQ